MTFHSLLATLLLVDTALGWTLPAVRPPNTRSLAVLMNAKEEAKIRESLGGEMPSDRHLTVAAAAGGAAGPDAPVALGADAEAAAKKASFEEAQALGAQLAALLSESCAQGQPMPPEAVTVLRVLISSTSGARGWFVTLLTNPDFEAVFRPPLDESLLSAISDNPDPNIKLMTMNVAMSTATELVHEANGNPELAAASRMTRDRSRILLESLLDRLPGLREEVAGLFSAVEPWETDDAGKQVPRADANAEWVKFTKKWRYNADQRAAIRSEIAAVLGKPLP